MAMTLDQQRAEAEADAARRADEAQVQGYIDKARGRVQGGAPLAMPAADPNTGQPAGVPAFSPNVYGTGDSAMAGLSNAGTFGFGDEAAAGIGSLISGAPYAQTLQEVRANQSKAQSENPGSYLGGQIAGGLAQAGLTGGAGFGMNAAKAGGSLGRVALGSGLDSAIYGGLLGAGNADGTLADRTKGGLVGAGVGGLTGLAAPFLAAGISQGVNKLISPFASSPEREAAVNLLAQEGVPVTAGQRVGSKPLQYAESEIGGKKAANMMEQQAEAFTNAAMQKAGTSGRATPDNLAALKADLGKQFEDIASRNTMVADQQMAQDIGNTYKRYNNLLETQQKPIVQNILGDLVDRVNANGGKLPGLEYQAIRSDLTSAAQSTTNQPLANAFRGIRNAMDDAFKRSISPDDASAWKTIQRQYGNYKVLNRASSGAGEAAGSGLINPAQLRVAATTGNREGFANGASDFTDLVKAGQHVLSPLPNSGTASRLSARSLGAAAPALLGAGYGYGNGGDLKSAAEGALLGYALQKGAGAALMSAPVQRYLGNQVAAGPANRVGQSLLASLLRNGSVQGLLGSRR